MHKPVFLFMLPNEFAIENFHHIIGQEKNPAVMADLFSKMPMHDNSLFVIRKLDVAASKKSFPSPLIRSGIHCFFYIVKGEALILIGEKSYLFKANECAVIPAGQMFSVRYHNDCTGFMGGFHIDFLNFDNENNSILRTFGFLRQWGSHKVLFDSRRGDYVSNIFERLCFENEERKNHKIIKAYLMALLVEIDEAYRNSASSKDEPSIENKLCNSFVELVFENANHSLPIAFYADKLNVAISHLHKTIKRFTGKTPLEWVNEAVLLESKIMLCHTVLTVNEIALKVGIHDPSYFSRLFKKHVGISPVSFRNETSTSNNNNPQKI